MSNTEFKEKDLEHTLHKTDLVELKEFYSAINNGKWCLIAITLISIVMSVIYAIKQPNVYLSEALVAPVEQDKTSSLAGLAGQFGGLASLAGVNLGAGASNKAKLAVEVIKSRQFFTGFMQNHEVLPDLFAAEAWDMNENIILYNADLYDVDNKKWVREVSPPYKQKPSVQEAYKKFREVFSVREDKDTGMITFSVQHISPFVAKQWVDWLVTDINNVMKEREVEEAQRSTKFLTEQLNNTNVVGIKAVLYKLIEEQAKTIMFANVRDEYVFKTIDPSVVSEDKFKPSRALICILGTLFGLLLGILFVSVLHFRKINKK